MRGRHYAKQRTDNNQKQIVVALEKAGCHVSPFGPVDLIVVCRGFIYFLEVKNGSKPRSQKRLTKEEAAFIEAVNLAGAPVHVVENEEDALRAVNAIRPKFKVVIKKGRPFLIMPPDRQDQNRPATEIETMLWVMLMGPPEQVESVPEKPMIVVPGR